MSDAIAQVKSLFFDREKVRRAMSDGDRKAFSKAGAFIRTGARGLLRKSKKISEPGKPPRMHEGSIKRLLFFAFDPASKSAVVGPARFKKGVAPHLLEKGGTVQGDGRVIYITRAVGRDRSGRFRSEGKDRIELHGAINYRPRPFMGPALHKEIDQGHVVSCWKDVI